MNIIGIDPGLATIGLGCIATTHPTDLQPLDYATIETAAHTETAIRLQEIRKDLLEYLHEYKPEIIVIEQLFFAVNEKTVINVAQARGVILEACAEQCVPILEPTPLQLKQAITGDGGADKLQVQQMVQTLLKLETLPKPDDAADGLGLAIYGALQAPMLTTLQ